jgi:hypothetical protein
MYMYLYIYIALHYIYITLRYIDTYSHLSSWCIYVYNISS